MARPADRKKPGIKEITTNPDEVRIELAFAAGGWQNLPTQSLGYQCRSLLRRHRGTHVRGIGFEGFDEPQMMLRRGVFLVVIVGPVPPNGARGGT